MMREAKNEVTGAGGGTIWNFAKSVDAKRMKIPCIIAFAKIA
jgi:hypothetical protein